MMRVTAEDLAALQRLLDESHAEAGAHLREVFSDERRIGAVELCALLDGVQVLNVATVTAGGEPRVAPVDGLFYHGRWYFGSSRDAARTRHIRVRPQVSASHTRGEELAVVTHGSARLLDVDEETGFRDYLQSVYESRYGEGWWESFGSSAIYARIDPEKMFTFRFAGRARMS